MYAILETGGKQYKVRPGDMLRVEKLPAEPGETVELDRVLMVADDEAVNIGTPLVDGARVVAEVLDQGRGRKIIVFKYKAKVRYRRKNGHRQPFTTLRVTDIQAPGGRGAKVAARSSEADAASEPAAEAMASPASGEPEGETQHGT